MSLLWVNAAKWGDPTPEFEAHEHYRYLRQHHDDTPEGIADPTLHDHIYPLHHDRPDGPTVQHPARNCPGYGPGVCTHQFTQDKMKPLVRQNWDVQGDRLFDPEAHAKREQDTKDQMSTFLLDYRLDHPDRVHKWNEDGTLGPSDDPRLGD